MSRKLFKAIRQKDNDTVWQMIQEKPELVNCAAKQPPKKDDGQSPLQVAIKTHNFEIADFDQTEILRYKEEAEHPINEFLALVE